MLFDLEAWSCFFCFCFSGLAFNVTSSGCDRRRPCSQIQIWQMLQWLSVYFKLSGCQVLMTLVRFLIGPYCDRRQF